MSGRRAEGQHAYPYTEDERKAHGQKRFVFYLPDDTECVIYRKNGREAMAAFRYALKRKARERKKLLAMARQTRRRIEEHAASLRKTRYYQALLPL